MRRYDKQLYETSSDDVSDEDVSTVGEVHKMFETILKVCTRHGRFRDTWNFPAKFSLMPFGQETVVESAKMGATYTLGLYLRKIFLSTYLLAPSHLKSMGDEFWSCFVELRLLGDFSFEENASPPSQEARKFMKSFKNTKSNIFQIIRNYILLEVYHGDSVDLGSLEVSWPLTASWNDILSNAVKAFRYLYKINYMLYRVGGPAQSPFDYRPSSPGAGGISF